jgi:hypothetical protein
MMSEVTMIVPGVADDAHRRMTTTYLDSSFERQKGIARITHLKNATEPVLGKVTNFENLQVWGHGAQVELADKNVVNDDRRLGRLVQGRREQVASFLVELGVRRERRPVEIEGHVEMAIIVSQPWGTGLCAVGNR